jgi:hypothetical protein
MNFKSVTLWTILDYTCMYFIYTLKLLYRWKYPLSQAWILRGKYIIFSFRRIFCFLTVELLVLLKDGDIRKPRAATISIIGTLDIRWFFMFSLCFNVSVIWIHSVPYSYTIWIGSSFIVWVSCFQSSENHYIDHHLYFSKNLCCCCCCWTLHNFPFLWSLWCNSASHFSSNWIPLNCMIDCIRMRIVRELS